MAADPQQLGPGRFGLPVMDTDDLYRLLAEVIGGTGPKDSSLPDTPAVRKWRAHLKKEVAEIVAKGGTPDVPHEW